ncbi:hypothetical protein TeGR_g7700, partial [Tetraparma gracilis]
MSFLSSDLSALAVRSAWTSSPSSPLGSLPEVLLDYILELARPARAERVVCHGFSPRAACAAGEPADEEDSLSSCSDEPSSPPPSSP